ncbi:hypothetical protein RCG23_15660 [Neobacillus sp. PS3-34]|nr:hypothetical protein [Neobacillus sp. PS3-34]WML47030.1 hypothetical protein RCG23_15660 [Neobacillus sp. PS3-34]
MNPLIQLRDVLYKVGNKTILDIPEFDLHSGEFLGIMGQTERVKVHC